MKCNSVEIKKGRLEKVWDILLKGVFPLKSLNFSSRPHVCRHVLFFALFQQLLPPSSCLFLMHCSRDGLLRLEAMMKYFLIVR